MVRTSKQIVYDYIKQESLKGVYEHDTLSIAEALKLQRSNVSAILNQLVAEGNLDKTNTRPVFYFLPSVKEYGDAFAKLVGNEGCLSNQIKLAKAAILYPKKSLSTLILGSPGTGKSVFARRMFDFSKEMKRVSQDAIYTRINARHYASYANEFLETLNKILLRASQSQLSQTFLVIDNIDVLDGKNIAVVNELIDSTQYVLDDGVHVDLSNVTLVLTSDININHEILQSLRNKIPVTIMLPDLKARPLEEKFELINGLFTDEASNTRHDIVIEPDVMKALLMVDSNYNIKFLQGAIKIAVANAYLRIFDTNSNIIKVVLDDFDKPVQDARIQLRNHRGALEQVIPRKFNYSYSKDGTTVRRFETSFDLYELIEEKLKKMQLDHLDRESINSFIRNEIQSIANEVRKEIRNYELNIGHLSKVVDSKVIKVVTEFVDEIQTRNNVSLSEAIIYGLCLHIGSYLKNRREVRTLPSIKLHEIMEQNTEEFNLATILSQKVKKDLGLEVAEEEVALLSMFFMNEEYKGDFTYPQLLITMHGDGAASAISKVINELVKVNNTYAYDMSLNSDSIQAYEELKQLLKSINTGSGVIVIYDMGSLKVILEKIIDEVDFQIRLIYMPITLIGIEASRKSSIDPDIDSVYHNILSGIKNEFLDDSLHRMAIVTLCHTGEGGAVEIKNYLQEHYRSDIKMYPLAISERKKLIKEVIKIRKYHDIKAFVGTYDPKLFGIPFIPVSKVFQTKPHELDRLIIDNLTSNSFDFDQMFDYLATEVNLDIDKLKRTLSEAIDLLDAEFALNLDQKVGLYLHIGTLVNRLVNNIPIKNKESIKHRMNQENYKKIHFALSKLERVFKIIIPEVELEIIYEIVKRDNSHE